MAALGPCPHGAGTFNSVHHVLVDTIDWDRPLTFIVRGDAYPCVQCNPTLALSPMPPRQFAPIAGLSFPPCLALNQNGTNSLKCRKY